MIAGASQVNRTQVCPRIPAEQPFSYLVHHICRGNTYSRGTITESPFDSPLPSGANTPLLLESSAHSKPDGRKSGSTSRNAAPKKQVVTCTEDFEPDELIPAYLESKTKLFQIQRPRQEGPKSGKSSKQRAPNDTKDSSAQEASDDLEEAKLLARITRIEQDVLFDKDLAEQKWRTDRINLEKEFAAAMKQKAEEAKQQQVESTQGDDAESDDEISKEAQRIAAEVLQQDDAEDDQALTDLFASLPTQEVDPDTGKTNTIINGTDGVKIYIRDFGKWSGISPVRALEEACRSR